MPGAAGERRRGGGCDQAHGASLRIGVQLGGALERASRGGVSAPPGRVVGGEGKVVGRLVVGSRGGGGAMPGPPIGVRVVAERRGERLVCRAPLGEPGSVVDGRAQQRMAEAHARAVGDQQARVLDRVERVGGHAEVLRRAQQRPHVAAVVDRCEQQQLPGVSGERFDVGHERSLDALAERQVEAQPCAPAELVIGEYQRQLEQGERVSPGSADEILTHPRGQRAVEQGAGVGVAQSGKPQLGQPVRVELAGIVLARCDEHCDRIGVQTPRHEHERVGRRAVEPVRVVDHAQQRLRVCGRGEQAQDGHRDEEAVLHAVGRQPERAPQRSVLHGRQLVGALQDGPQQLVQARERQLGLGLHGRAGEHPHAVGALPCVCQQRGLADPRLAAQYEDAAARGPGCIEHAVDRLALAVTAEQHAPTLRRDR
jgi:hypothetical protein